MTNSYFTKVILAIVVLLAGLVLPLYTEQIWNNLSWVNDIYSKIVLFFSLILGIGFGLLFVLWNKPH